MENCFFRRLFDSKKYKKLLWASKGPEHTRTYGTEKKTTAVAIVNSTIEKS